MPTPKPIPFIFTEQEIIRFWKHVDRVSLQGPNGDCWEWQLSRHGKMRYGTYTMQHDSNIYSLSTHRIAYYLQFENPNNQCVCHHCDNPPCVRGDHLFLGTHQDNKDDSVAKGRHFRGPRPNIENFKRGEEMHWAKLTDEQVAEIIDLQKSGMTASAISRLGTYPVSRRAIAYVIEGQTWKHI